MSCELKLQKTKKLAEHLGFKVCSCKKHIVQNDDTIPKTPEGFYDWDLINSVPDLQINTFSTQKKHHESMIKHARKYRSDAYYMKPGGTDFRGWVKIKGYYNIFTPLDIEFDEDEENNVEWNIDKKLMKNFYKDQRKLGEAIFDYYKRNGLKDNYDIEFKDIVKLGLNVYTTKEYGERGEEYHRTRFINFTKFTKSFVSYEIWEREIEYENKKIKYVIKKYPYRKKIQEFRSREMGFKEYIKVGNTEEELYPNRLVHLKDNIKLLRTSEDAANILVRAWKKCRYNPNYKMCWKVQLKDLEENCGMTFDENDNMVPVN